MNFKDWKWLNESKVTENGDGIAIYSPGKVDWFCNPIPNAGGTLDAPVASAPFLYTDVKGDFVFSAKVTPHHKNTYDACALMVIKNEKLWAKLAFEASDFGTTAAVCVVTNDVSDDANGCDISQDSIWLKICRVGDIFSTHYSLDGETYHMVRLFRLPAQETVKVGMEMQCPTGDGTEGLFEDVKLEQKTVKNLRKGE